MPRTIWLLLLICSAACAEDNFSRLRQHKVTAKNSPAPEPGAENELIPSLVDGLQTPEDWYQKKRPELMRLWTQILGKIGPDENDRRWFGDVRKAVVRDRRELENYTRLEVDLPIEKDFYQNHLLLLPKNQGRGPFPAVVCWNLHHAGLYGAGTVVGRVAGRTRIHSADELVIHPPLPQRHELRDGSG